jgi:type IV secretion system protein VirB1
LASKLILVDHHSVDLGLMQINSGNLADLKLTISETFDACRNVAAGARVLTAGYFAPPAGGDTQPALHQSLSRYNTGDRQRGFVNGYVARVQASAEQIVPAIRLRSDVGSRGADTPTTHAAPSPPPWDVYARARAAKEEILVWLSRNLNPAPPFRAIPIGYLYPDC